MSTSAPPSPSTGPTTSSDCSTTPRCAPTTSPAPATRRWRSLYFSRHGEMPLGRLERPAARAPDERHEHGRRARTTGPRQAGQPPDRPPGDARPHHAQGPAGDGPDVQHHGRRLLRAVGPRRTSGHPPVRRPPQGAGRRRGHQTGRGHRAARARQLEDPVLEAERNWAAHGWAAGPYFRTSLSIYRTAELIRQSNDSSLRPFRLTHSRHEALAVLYFSRHGEMPMGKLGAVLLVHPTSVTGTVDTLERLGLRRAGAPPHGPAHHARPDHRSRPARRRGVERRHDRDASTGSPPCRARRPGPCSTS